MPDQNKKITEREEPTDLFLENGLVGSSVVRENTILLNCR